VREDVFKRTIGNESSLHEISSEMGLE